MTKLILFTGKGGVGKSTSAAATALYHANQGQKTLLVSSDPAHSTDDTVGTKVGETPREISPNLFAMNINAVSVTERQRFILRVRSLARGVAEEYYASRKRLGFPLAPDALKKEFLEE